MTAKRMVAKPDDCLVVVQISSHRVTATVAWRDREGERVVAHRGLPCEWHDLEPRGRRQALLEVLDLAGRSAGIRPLSIVVAVIDPGIRANFASGYADLGEEMVLGEAERDLALARATHQPIGTEREVLHALPQRWSVRDAEGEFEVDSPIGERGSRITCSVLLVTASRALRRSLEDLLLETGIYLEGVIAQPVALYRGLVSHLPARGSTLIVDCGARHTSLLVHRKQRLVHIETHPVGGDHLTHAIAREVGTTWQHAEQLKRELDIGAHVDSAELEGQTFLWREVQERHRLLSPAARACHRLLTDFFVQRAHALRDLELLAQHGRIHLTGRAAALGGLPNLLRDVFDLPVVLGSSKHDREASSELADLLTVGLVRQSAIERERRLAERNASGMRQVTTAASGFLSWLLAPIE